MKRYLMKTSPETLELLEDTADEMVSQCGISRAEAVARINRHWEGLDLSGPNDLILHEDETYWALAIYYEEVPDWQANADRANWRSRPTPPAGSVYWTEGQA